MRTARAIERRGSSVTFGKKVKHARSVPASVEWSAAMFLGIAAFWTVVHVGSGSVVEAIRDWKGYLIVWLLFGGVAFAVVRGLNWVRWVFVGLAMLSVASFLLSPGVRIRRTTPVAWDRGITVAGVVAAGLCFLPASNRYFRKRKEPNQSPEPTRMLGTSAAEQPRVPSTRVAHL